MATALRSADYSDHCHLGGGGRGDGYRPHLHAAVLEVALPFGVHLLLVLDERRQAQRLPVRLEALQLHQRVGRAATLPARRH